MSQLAGSHRHLGREGNHKASTDVQARKTQSIELLKKNPGRIPVILEVSSKSKLSPLKKYKHLVPKDYKLNQLVSLAIRSELTLPQDCSLSILCSGMILSQGSFRP